MGFLIDTSILIEIENDNKEIIKKIEQLGKAELFITIFNFCEYYYGLLNKSQKNQDKLTQRLEEYRLLNTSLRSGTIFCKMLSELKKEGRTVPQFDLFIAAIAVENNLTLISMDEHFRNIPRLSSVIISS